MEPIFRGRDAHQMNAEFLAANSKSLEALFESECHYRLQVIVRKVCDTIDSEMLFLHDHHCSCATRNVINQYVLHW
jgi:hypothetical protein